MKQQKTTQEATRQHKRVRKGDTVIVMRGASRGRSGVVLSRTDEQVVVQGVNLRKKHVKASQEQPKGSIVELEKPIHVSNVAVSVNGEAVKLRIRENKDGERELYHGDDSKSSTYRSVKKQ